MIAKILNYFDIGFPNLAYKSPGSSQEFSHCTLVNMNYFWDVIHQVYYLGLSKHGRKVYNFDDPIEYGDDAAEAHMDHEQPMEVHHDGTEGDAVMHDAPRGDDYGANFSIDYADTTSIMTMLQDMQMK